MEKTKEYTDLLEELRKDLGPGKDGDIVARVQEAVFKKLESLPEDTKRKFSSAMGLTEKVEEKPIKRLGDFAQAVYAKEHNLTSIRGKSTENIVKALGESQGSTGGFLLYEEFKPELLKLIIAQLIEPR